MTVYPITKLYENEENFSKREGEGTRVIQGIKQTQNINNQKASQQKKKQTAKKGGFQECLDQLTGDGAKGSPKK